MLCTAMRPKNCACFLLLTLNALHTSRYLFISRVLQSLKIPAIQLRHDPLRGVDSVCLQILLKARTCQQYGSWSVDGHSHRKVIGRDPIYASYCYYDDKVLQYE